MQRWIMCEFGVWCFRRLGTLTPLPHSQTCDDGYTVDAGGVCVEARCEQECLNGACEFDSATGNMTCACLGAYEGADCGTCACDRGSCNTVTKLCDCETDWAGTRCQYVGGGAGGRGVTVKHGKHYYQPWFLDVMQRQLFVPLHPSQTPTQPRPRLEGTSPSPRLLRWPRPRARLVCSTNHTCFTQVLDDAFADDNPYHIRDAAVSGLRLVRRTQCDLFR